MKILKTIVGSGASLFSSDTIEFQGGVWLVPEWLNNYQGRYKFPARIIRIDLLKFQKAPTGFPADFILNDPIPKSVLDGQKRSEDGVNYEVIDTPDIHIPIVLPNEN